MDEIFRKRVTVFYSVIVLIFILAVLRVFQFSVLEKEKMTSQADSARSGGVTLESQRGNIYDRNGISFTNNDTNSKIIIQPSIFRKSKDFSQINVKLISEITSEDPLMLNSRMEKLNSAFTLNVDPKKTNLLIGIKFEGVTIVYSKKRFGESRIAEHVLGYLDSTGEKGVSGFESSLNDFLNKGSSSVLDYTHDAKNEAIKGLGMQLTKKEGKSLSVITTLDYYIQDIVEQVLDEKVKEDPTFKAGVVVSDTSDGSVVAMSSRPNFDRGKIAEELNDSSNPFLNRATLAYNLGSVFKIVDTATWLEFFSPEPPIGVCKGWVKVGNRIIKCAQLNGHGFLDLNQAFQSSCNPFFVHLGITMGSQKVLQMANRLGLGKAVGVQGLSESIGSLPKATDFFNDGDVANFILGQGKITATPLQVASIVNTVVNNGQMIQPWILKSVIDSEGTKLGDFPKAPIGKAFSEKSALRLKKLMVLTVEKGTGYPARPAGNIGAGGKTGSAESGTGGKTHAWFAGFLPANNPRYTIVVVVENGGHGGLEAGPIFKKIADKMVQNNIVN